jgi:hypothetical protein
MLLVGIADLLHCVLPAELVKQLLDAGASVNDPSGLCQLQPLHLACMPRISSVGQVRREPCQLLGAVDTHAVQCRAGTANGLHATCPWSDVLAVLTCTKYSPICMPF